MRPADANSSGTSAASRTGKPPIGPAIRRLRKILEMSQEDLAHEIGVTVSTVNRWENQHSEPLRVVRRQLEALAARAGVALD